MTSNTHTPGEWKISNNSYTEQISIHTGNELCPIAFLNYQNLRGLNNRDEQEANAARIVKCVNNHDRLLEALKAASLSLSTFVESNAWEPDDQKAYDQAEAAIKEATE